MGCAVDVSVIIVNYNAGTLLCDCLDSIFQNTEGVKFEVIVVDNMSTDGSVESAKKTFPAATYLISSENKGFASGNNLGAKHTIGKYLFLLNPDTVLHTNSIQSFYRFMEENQYVGVCGGIILDKENKPFYAGGDFPSLWEVFYNAFQLKRLFPRHWFPCSGKTFSPDIKEPVPVDYVIGANFFTRRDLYLSLGGLDEDFFAYFEETDFCYRMAPKYKAMIVPESRIVHLQGKSFGVNLFQMKTYFESELKFFYKRSRTKWAVAYLLHLFGNSIWYVIYRVLRPEKSEVYYNRCRLLLKYNWKTKRIEIAV